jgi:hypothetical protein
MMTQSLKTIALAATALAAISSPLATAQAQNGYDYLFWPLFTAWPAPKPVPGPAPVAAPIPAPIATPRRAQIERPRETEVRYAREADHVRQLFPSGNSPHDFVIGIGF